MNLRGANIHSYVTDWSKLWCAVSGLQSQVTFIFATNNFEHTSCSLQEAGRVAGVTQLFSVSKGISQPVNSVGAATFGELRLDGMSLTLVAFFQDNKNLLVFELDNADTGEKRFGRRTLSLSDHIHPDDLVLHLRFLERYGLICIVARTGKLVICEIDTTTILFSFQQFSTPQLAVASLEDGSGLVSLGPSGEMTVVRINEERLLQELAILGKDEVAQKITQRSAEFGDQDILIKFAGKTGM